MLRLALLGGAVAVLGLFVAAVYWTGHRAGAAACEARVAAATAAEVERQRQVVDAVQDEARRDAEARAVEIDALEQQVEDYEAELAKRGPAVCVLDDDDARRLRNIR